MLKHALRDEKSSTFAPENEKRVYHSIAVLRCLRPGAGGTTDNRRAGAGGDGLADIRANGKGGKGAPRGRQYPIHGNEQRLRLSPADVQEQETGGVLYASGEEREEGAAHCQGSPADAHRDNRVLRNAAQRQGEGRTYQARGRRYLPYLQAEDEEADLFAGIRSH